MPHGKEGAVAKRNTQTRSKPDTKVSESETKKIIRAMQIGAPKGQLEWTIRELKDATDLGRRAVERCVVVLIERGIIGDRYRGAGPLYYLNVLKRALTAFRKLGWYD